MRIAYFLTHPLQYQSPLIRHLRAGGVYVHVVAVQEMGGRKLDLDAISAAGASFISTFTPTLCFTNF
jgi:hypothetical protein